MSKLLIDANPLQIIPALAQSIGLNEAIVLQQMHYWLNADHNKNKIDNRHWVYNTYEEWQKQFPFWSIDTIRRTILSLEQQDLILSTKMNGDKFNHRKWYSINYERLHDLESLSHRSVQNAKIEGCKMPRSKTATCHYHYKEQRLPTEITHKTLSPISLPKPAISSPSKTTQKEREEGLNMIEIFSKIVLNGQMLLPQSERLKKLKDVLHSQLQGKLENWEKVCQNITRSKFLMGEAKSSDFKVTLDWIITKDHAIKIFEGNVYGIGDRAATSSLTVPTVEEQEELLFEFKKSNKHPLWCQAGQILFRKVEFSIFKNLISLLDIHEIHKDYIELLAPTPYIRDYMNKNLFSIPIKQALETALGHEVRFVHAITHSTSELETKASNAETVDFRHFELVPQTYFPALSNPYFSTSTYNNMPETLHDPPTKPPNIQTSEKEND